jgi:hypothetical protein
MENRGITGRLPRASIGLALIVVAVIIGVAVFIASRLKTEGIDSARANIEKLKEISDKLEEKVSRLPAQPAQLSIEA